jgi:hypothetical protein
MRAVLAAAAALMVAGTGSAHAIQVVGGFTALDSITVEVPIAYRGLMTGLCGPLYGPDEGAYQPDTFRCTLKSTRTGVTVTDFDGGFHDLTGLTGDFILAATRGFQVQPRLATATVDSVEATRLSAFGMVLDLNQIIGSSFGPDGFGGTAGVPANSVGIPRIFRRCATFATCVTQTGGDGGPFSDYLVNGNTGFYTAGQAASLFVESPAGISVTVNLVPSPSAAALLPLAFGTLAAVRRQRPGRG